MFYIRKDKKLILKVVGFLLIFHTTLFSSSLQIEESLHVNSTYSSVDERSGGIVKEKVEVSFDNTSIMLMLVLTSLLGTFFVKDELSDAF